MTNRQYLQKHRGMGFYPSDVGCEWEPLEHRPARLDDDFHGLAEVAIGRLSKDSAKKDRRLRVCRACSEEPECTAYCVPFGSAKQIELPKGVMS